MQNIYRYFRINESYQSANSVPAVAVRDEGLLCTEISEKSAVSIWVAEVPKGRQHFPPKYQQILRQRVESDNPQSIVLQNNARRHQD